MRLLLLSLGLGAVPEYLGAAKSVAFVPTAGNPYDDPWFVREDRSRLEQLGYSVVDVDLSHIRGQRAVSLCEEADAIFVAGGNTFFLLQEMRESRLDAPLSALLLAGKPYVGASAGAVVLGPTVEPIQALDDASQAPGLKAMDGLGIVEFVTLPHYGKEKYIPKYNQIQSEYQGALDLVLLKDTEALLVTAPNRYERISSNLILQKDKQ